MHIGDSDGPDETPATIVSPRSRFPLTQAERESYERTRDNLIARYGCQLVFDPELLIREEPSVAPILTRRKFTPFEIRNLAIRGAQTPEECMVLTTAMVAGLRRDAYRRREMNT